MTKKRLLWLGGGLAGLLCLWVATIALGVAVSRLRVPVNLPPQIYVGGFDSIVTATGTWVIEGERQAFPLQTTRITCERELQRCTVATAQVMYGDQLHTHLDFYRVVEWGKGYVVFSDDSATCVRYVYTIDIRTKAVNGIRRKNPNAQGDCNMLASELRLNLSDGFKVSDGLATEAIPWFGKAAIAPLKAFF